MPECQLRTTKNYQLQWDEWGVPTIKAQTMQGLFEGSGFAQAFLNHNLLLITHLRARGKSAEYLGEHSGLGSNLMTKQPNRSEERRVGKECRSRVSPDH